MDAYYQPYISVIVTVRNEEATIRQCLTSLTNQTLSKELYEIVVVDGKSTDKTCKIVEEISKSSLASITLIEQAGSGISNARNTGIKRSRGEVIVFIDGDAYAQQNCLEIYYRDFKKNDGLTGFEWGQAVIANRTSFIASSLYSVYYSLIGAHGANIAYNRNALTEVECFDENFKGRYDEVAVNIKLLNAGYVSKKAEGAIVEHELPSSSLQFLKLRFKDGIGRRRVYRLYFTGEMKKSHKVKYFLKGFALFIFTVLFATLISINLLYGFAFITLSYALFLLIHTHIGVTIKSSNIIYVTIGMFLTTIGYVLEFLGEMAETLHFWHEERLGHSHRR